MIKAYYNEDMSNTLNKEYQVEIYKTNSDGSFSETLEIETYRKEYLKSRTKKIRQALGYNQ